MNKQIKILLLILVVALGFYFLVTRKPWRSFSGDEADFAIADTASITKIFIADVRGEQVLLTKENGTWLVNGKVAADVKKMELLLQTIHDVKMRNPVSQNEHNTVVKEFAALGIKAEFYGNDKLIKTIYVGRATNDKVGTYMMLEGASSPYVAHIPGFVGYLTPRFPTNPVKWKSKLVFDIPADAIKSMKVDYPDAPQESFTITNEAEPTLKGIDGKTVQADVNYLKYLLASFSQLHGEAFDDNYTSTQQDSIARTPVFCEIKIERKDGQSSVLKLHSKSIDNRTKFRYDEAGRPIEFDTEKYFGFVNGERDMMYIQQYNFGRIIKRLSEVRLMKPTP
jgi:hypothetical protein